jgi:excisionase family DNA binding protein
MSEQDPRVSVDEVAKHLGTVCHTVYRWIDGEGLAGHRVGRLWKFGLSDIDQSLRARGADGGPTGARVEPNE